MSNGSEVSVLMENTQTLRHRHYWKHYYRRCI